MRVSRRLTGLAVAAVAAVTLPVTFAQPAAAACAPGTYPPSNCAPQLSMRSMPRFTLGRGTPSWTVKYAGAPIARYQARYTRAAWNGNFQGWVYPASWQNLHTTYVSHTLPVGYTYCYSARAIDTANRVGPWTPSRCTARPLDDRAMTASSGWHRSTSSSMYFGTYTWSGVHNARLYRTNANTARIAVVGSTCSYCGTLYVYVGSQRVGTLDFFSTTTKYHQIRATAPFSLRRGTISLRFIAGSRVFVDGLGVSRV